MVSDGAFIFHIHVCSYPVVLMSWSNIKVTLSKNSCCWRISVLQTQLRFLAWLFYLRYCYSLGVVIVVMQKLTFCHILVITEHILG